MPILYIGYQDMMDLIASRAGVEVQKHYSFFYKKVISKISRCPVKPKRKK